MRLGNMFQAWLGFSATRTEQESCRPPCDVQLPVRVLTHNIRYATSSPGKNEKPWKDRLPLIMNELSYHTRFFDGKASGSTDVLEAKSVSAHPASFICLQEVLHSQLHDILRGLNGISASVKSKVLPEGPHWAHIGVAREDGKTKGEYSPILYPTHLFELLHFENAWLSPTPHKPSKGWDAGSERILTTGVFKHRATSQRFAVFNTHLDNAGSEAREKSVAIILDVIERVRTQWAQDKGAGAEHSHHAALNFFLAGDFNSFPTQEAYKAVAASGEMVDTYTAIQAARRYGEEVTFTGFQPDTNEDEDEIGRIDFVWFGPASAVRAPNVSDEPRGPDQSSASPLWLIEGYSVVSNVFEDGVFCSDHRAVIADALFLA